MIAMKDVATLTKEFKILYAEDEPSIQSEMKEIFSMFFKEIIIANDGKEGLELFHKHKDIDLIISDIQMPNMDGLEMAKKIRETSDVPIIMITAFNDQDFFIKSIDIKIDKYMLKPIDDKQMVQIFYDVATRIHEKKEYEKLKFEDEQRKIKAKQQDTIEKITDAFISPTIIYSNDKLVYCSKPFMKLFKSKDIDLKTTTLKTILFDEKKGCMHSLSDYDKNNQLNNKVYIKQNVGNRIFKVINKEITFEDDLAQMYILIDITMEEYQKIKIESYLKSLESYMIKTKKKELLPNKVQIEKNVEISTDTQNNKTLSQEETNKLRKRHAHVMTSAELVELTDDFIIEGLQELDDLDSDLYDSMTSFDQGDFSKIVIVSKLLQRYADEIYIIEQFEDLYASIKSLADLLSTIDMSSVDKSKYSEFALYINSIREDLSLWRKSIFIEQNTDNIHYLDSSLFSTALHIELLLSGQDDVMSDDEDDLEFF